MSISVLNTDANLSGKTLLAAENADTITGLKTFSRGAAPPFACAVGSTNVANLDADKVDGAHLAALAQLGLPNAFTDATDSTTAGTGAITTAGGIGVAKGLSVGTIINLIGGQIGFPAVQVPSVGVNVLDDYEEGTWTPVVTGTAGSGITCSQQAGTYVKIGKLVYCSATITLSSLGTASGTVSITGLPFTAGAGLGEHVSGSIGYYASLTTAVIWIPWLLTAGTAVLSLNKVTAAAVTSASPQLTIADLSAVTQMIFAFCYRANG
jgi:hypothetical protein